MRTSSEAAGRNRRNNRVRRNRYVASRPPPSDVIHPGRAYGTVIIEASASTPMMACPGALSRSECTRRVARRGAADTDGLGLARLEELVVANDHAWLQDQRMVQVSNTCPPPAAGSSATISPSTTASRPASSIPFGQLGIGGGDVTVIAAEHPHIVGVEVGDRADTIPLELEPHPGPAGRSPRVASIGAINPCWRHRDLRYGRRRSRTPPQVVAAGGARSRPSLQWARAAATTATRADTSHEIT
jgi:hypothetical protein